MILGFVADAHGNATALAACLAALESEGASRFYFLGDAVGYLPEESAVLNLLRLQRVICIRGNHEAMLLGELPLPEARDQVYRISEARMRLAPDHRTFISGWPLRWEVTEGSSRFLLVHGSPASPLEGYVYPQSDLSGFAALPFDFVVMGQTHRPFIRSAGAVTAVNVGSAGIPRDGGSLASCAKFDVSSRKWEVLRVRFDAEAIIARCGERVHASVAACLRRPAPAEIVGRVINLPPPK